MPVSNRRHSVLDFVKSAAAPSYIDRALKTMPGLGRMKQSKPVPSTLKQLGNAAMGLVKRVESNPVGRALTKGVAGASFKWK